jgi:hypothetical protein
LAVVKAFSKKEEIKGDLCKNTWEVRTSKISVEEISSSEMEIAGYY